MEIITFNPSSDLAEQFIAAHFIIIAKDTVVNLQLDHYLSIICQKPSLMTSPQITSDDLFYKESTSQKPQEGHVSFFDATMYKDNITYAKVHVYLNKNEFF